MTEEEKELLRKFVPPLTAYLRDLLRRSDMPLNETDTLNLLGKIGMRVYLDNMNSTSASIPPTS